MPLLGDELIELAARLFLSKREECLEVDIVTNDVALQINGVSISADLNDKATRRMIEYAAIVATSGIDVELANR